MNKDVVYIDVEDDITNIVGKVRASNEKVVAVVPPKSVGALQSIVNLKLLAKMAKQAGKHVVVISSNPSFGNLALAAGLPVATNLQSKPKLPEEVESDEAVDIDVIDGDQISVGEHAGISKSVADEVNESLIDAIALEDDGSSSKDRQKKPKKVPNFDKFRTKLIIGIAAALLLIGGIVWAVVFAPAANIIVTARTSKVEFSEEVKLTTDAQKVDSKKGLFLMEKKELVKTSQVEFTPTGTKDVGDKATGTMTLTRTRVSSAPISIPAGTTFSAGTIVFVSIEAAILEGPTVGSGGLEFPSVTVKVEAAEIGEEYNVPAGAYGSSVGGYNSEGSAMAGGTKKSVKVVSEEDINKAKENLVASDNNAGKKELAASFGGDYVTIEASVEVKLGDLESEPKKDEETTVEKAKLTSKTTYSMYGVKKSELKKYIDDKLKERLASQADQKVYSDGLDSAFIGSYISKDDGATGKLVTTVETGPELGEEDIISMCLGKKYGEVQSRLESINGVADVDVEFSFFWVSTVPKDKSKVTVKFEVE